MKRLFLTTASLVLIVAQSAMAANGKCDESAKRAAVGVDASRSSSTEIKSEIDQNFATINGSPKSSVENGNPLLTYSVSVSADSQNDDYSSYDVKLESSSCFVLSVVYAGGS